MRGCLHQKKKRFTNMEEVMALTQDKDCKLSGVYNKMIVEYVMM